MIRYDYYLWFGGARQIFYHTTHLYLYWLDILFLFFVFFFLLSSVPYSHRNDVIRDICVRCDGLILTVAGLNQKKKKKINETINMLIFALRYTYFFLTLHELTIDWFFFVLIYAFGFKSIPLKIHFLFQKKKNSKSSRVKGYHTPIYSTWLRIILKKHLLIIFFCLEMLHSAHDQLIYFFLSLSFLFNWYSSTTTTTTSNKKKIVTQTKH